MNLAVLSRRLVTYYEFWRRHWPPHQPKGDPVFTKLKKYLTSKPEETRIIHYAEVFAGTFGLAAIASAEHVASLHEPIGWSVIFGVAAAGGKAVVDLAKPLVIGWFTKKSLG